jgi:hypothetical protein
MFEMVFSMIKQFIMVAFAARIWFVCLFGFLTLMIELGILELSEYCFLYLILLECA